LNTNNSSIDHKKIATKRTFNALTWRQLAEIHIHSDAGQQFDSIVKLMPRAYNYIWIVTTYAADLHIYKCNQMPSG